MLKSLDNNFIPQDLLKKSCLNDEPQESNKKLESINDANSSYSK